MNNLLKIDYMECMRKLMSQAFSLKKYKAMNGALAVFTFIFMIPFLLMSLMGAGMYMCVAFFHRVITTPIRALHGLMNSEGKDVRHAPQTVIYIVSWPVIFFLYFMEAMAIPTLTVLYASTSVATYVWSLGGYKFHAFPEKVDECEIEVEGRYNILPIVYVAITTTIVALIPLLHMLVDYTEYVSRSYGYGANNYTFAYYGIYIGLSIIFSFFYSIFGFARHPKKGAYKEANQTNNFYQNY